MSKTGALKEPVFLTLLSDTEKSHNYFRQSEKSMAADRGIDPGDKFNIRFKGVYAERKASGIATTDKMVGGGFLYFSS